VGCPAYAGQGLITEGTKAIVAFGFARLGVRRIFAMPDEENEASCRLCERIGLSFERVLRNERTDPDGTPHHARLYASMRA